MANEGSKALERASERITKTIAEQADDIRKELDDLINQSENNILNFFDKNEAEQTNKKQKRQ